MEKHRKFLKNDMIFLLVYSFVRMLDTIIGFISFNDVSFTVFIIELIVIVIKVIMMCIELYLLEKKSKYVANFAIIIGLIWCLGGMLPILLGIWTINHAIKYNITSKVGDYDTFKIFRKKYLKTFNGRLFYNVPIIIEVFIFTILCLKSYYSLAIFMTIIISTIGTHIFNSLVIKDCKD